MKGCWVGVYGVMIGGAAGKDRKVGKVRKIGYKRTLTCEREN